MTILIVEDELIAARSLRNILLKLGYTSVEEVHSAEMALVRLNQIRFDLALVDIMLGDSKGGVDVARRLSATRVPFVFVSSYSDRSTLRVTRETEAAGYIVKPYTPDQIFAAVETALATDVSERGLEVKADLEAIAQCAVDIIARRFHENLSIEEISNLCGCSRVTLTRALGQVHGCSPYQLLIRQRISQAGSRLTESDDSVLDIARQCGFKSGSHFSRLFRERTSMTPLQYRFYKTPIE